MFKLFCITIFLLVVPYWSLASISLQDSCPQANLGVGVGSSSLLFELEGAYLKTIRNSRGDEVTRLVSPKVNDRNISFTTSVNNNSTIYILQYDCFSGAISDPKNVEIAARIYDDDSNKYQIFFRPIFSERFHLDRPPYGLIASIPEKTEGVNFYGNSFIAIVYDGSLQSPKDLTFNCPSKDFGAYELEWCIRGDYGSIQTFSTDVTLRAKDTSDNSQNYLFSLEVAPVMKSARLDMNYLALNAIHNFVLDTLKISMKGKTSSTDRVKNQANIPPNTRNFFYKFSNQPQTRLFIPRGFKFLFDSDNQVVLTTNKNILDQRTALFSNLVVTKISDESFSDSGLPSEISNLRDPAITVLAPPLPKDVSRTVQCKGYKFEFSTHWGQLNGVVPGVNDLMRDHKQILNYLSSVCKHTFTE